MAKKITIVVEQIAEDRFKVLSFANTSDLRIGMEIGKERFDKWMSLKNVNMRVKSAKIAPHTH